MLKQQRKTDNRAYQLTYKQKIINAVYYLPIRISCTSTPKFC